MPTLLVIGDEDTPGVARDLVGRASKYWVQRNDCAPEVEYRTIESMLREPVDGNEWDAALVMVSAEVSEGLLYQLVGQLEEAATPSVVVQSPGSERESVSRPRHDRSPECIFASTREGPEAVSAMLFALAHRQPSVREMQRGLRAAKSFQNEASAELDRLHDELLLAAQVQREVLPKQLPSVRGLGMGVLFRPAGFVSGDIYDIDRLDEEYVGFFLADAMGHGVPAALMTLFISGSLPQKDISSAGYRLVPPAESLARLNQSMCASRVGSTRFATAVCGQIHVPTGRVRLASAGHPPALVIRDGSARAVELDGPLLGVFDDATFEECEFVLGADERLVVHSDGLEEAYSPRTLSEESLGPAPVRHVDAMARVAGACAGVGTPEFITRLAEDMDSQAGSMHQHDDVSVLGFGREG